MDFIYWNSFSARSKHHLIILKKLLDIFSSHVKTCLIFLMCDLFVLFILYQTLQCGRVMQKLFHTKYTMNNMCLQHKKTEGLQRKQYLKLVRPRYMYIYIYIYMYIINIYIYIINIYIYIYLYKIIYIYNSWILLQFIYTANYRANILPNIEK